jgi:hypothetical protein
MNWQFEAVDHALTNATYWNVNLYNTEQDRDGFMREDFSLLDHNHETRNLDIAVRPYLQMASAIPVNMHFNLRSREFTLALMGPVVSDKPTRIYVPALAIHDMQPIHYPNGFRVEYSGKGTVRFSDNILELMLDPTETHHTIRITDPSSESRLPEARTSVHLHF